MYRVHHSYNGNIHDNIVDKVQEINNTSKVFAIVRGGDPSIIPPPDNPFQVITGTPISAAPNLLSERVEFSYVISDEGDLWDAVNHVFTIPETGTYLIKFSIFSSDTDIGSDAVPVGGGITTLGTFLRIFDSDLNNIGDCATQIRNGGVGRAITSLSGELNIVFTQTLSNSLILNLNKGEKVGIYFIMITIDYPSPRFITLLDPVSDLQPDKGDNLLGSFFSINKLE